MSEFKGSLITSVLRVRTIKTPALPGLSHSLNTLTSPPSAPGHHVLGQRPPWSSIPASASGPRLKGAPPVFRETDTGSIGVLSDFSKPQEFSCPGFWLGSKATKGQGWDTVGRETVIWLLTVTWAAQGPSCSQLGQGAGRTLHSCQSNPDMDLRPP